MKNKLIKNVNLLILVNMLTLLILSGCNVVEELLVEEEQVVTTVIKDDGDISVYFCPRDDCEGALVDFLESAEESIDCAFFELNLERVIDVLKEKNSDIKVRLVIDGENAEEVAGLDFVRLENRSAYMHNKFCIVDGRKISSGSMNPTVNGVSRNNNNLIFIWSSSLAKNYGDEFEELWNGAWGKGEKVKRPEVYLNSKLIENYFCPEDTKRELSLYKIALL